MRMFFDENNQWLCKYNNYRGFKMDIQSARVELACNTFKKHVSSFNVNHVAVSSLCLETNKIDSLCSDYRWHVDYWGMGLYKKIGKRCEPGLRYWDELDNEHSRLVFEKTNSQLKVDFATRHGNFIEIFSIGMKNRNSRFEISEIIRAKPKVSNLLHIISKEHGLEKIQVPNTPSGELLVTSDSDIEGKYYRFGDIRFTKKEMETIRLLLQLRSPKEISWYHSCTYEAEKKRINNIKEKLGCKGSPLSSVHDALNFYGITLSCAINTLKYPLNAHV
ncbi:hypothetical protein M9194_19825 [Vibrio sp. S4M6]|uniref:hypothetical protein n=1 Tax=Vibrio sinus TaxID=2946865 RepID=UPI00202A2909|nr:hypothetical protein [Vibrio sinus]MCL9783678.1 hypothetical protein [Vibrio sinus]